MQAERVHDQTCIQLLAGYCTFRFGFFGSGHVTLAKKKIWVLPCHPTASMAAKDGAGTRCSGGSLGKAPAGTVPPSPPVGRGLRAAAPPAQVGWAPVPVGAGEPPGRARLELLVPRQS